MTLYGAYFQRHWISIPISVQPVSLNLQSLIRMIGIACRVCPIQLASGVKTPGTKPRHAGNKISRNQFLREYMWGLYSHLRKHRKIHLKNYFKHTYSHVRKHAFAPSPLPSVWLQWLYSHTPDANT